MKQKISKQSIEHISKIGLILVLIAVIVYLFPTENKSKYHFEIGKPWTYELVTAAFDFPVYKNSDVVEKETQEILKNFAPYYTIDTTIVDKQLKKINESYQLSNNDPDIFQYFLQKKLTSIYEKGIISADDMTEIQKSQYSQIHFILPSRHTKLVNPNEIYTPKSAYKELLKGASEQLKNYDLNLYLTENLKLDTTTTNAAKKELLNNLSLTTGMVQAGERIIDRGEIVTPESFAVLNSLKVELQKRKSVIQQSSLVLIGEAIIISGLIALFFIYLYLFRPRIYDNFSNLIFISLLILIITGLSSIVVRYTDWNYFMIPYALLPIIIRVFFDSRTALFVHIITVLIISFMIDNSFRFVVMQIAIGMAAVSSLKDMTQRSQLAQTAFYIFLSYTGLYLAFEFISEGEFSKINWTPILHFGISSAFLLLAYVLIYIFEKIFGLISAITLVELTNVNSDLMMKFAETAPGTFQHTLQVSNLATEAAKKIGANSLLVRTGALYHDIGKMKNPHFFIENQLGGPNPLSELDFEEASRIVIQHVTDGVEIARKNHLPDQIISFIVTHHGLGKTKYFYNSFINANPGVTPNEEAFTYPGPLPMSKETAILMMADAVEARSRSLSEYTEESINEAIEKMIDLQISDGQFKEAPISFRDVETVKSVFKEKIKNIYHSRIVYPELKKDNKEKK